MTRTRAISTAERRARIGVRHALTPGARVASPSAAADAVVALHSTDAATVFLSACVRLERPEVSAVEKALYDDPPQLVKLLAMRRTLFAVSRATAPYVDAAAARAIAERERKNLLRQLADWNGKDAAWLAKAEDAALAVLAEKGEATGQEIAAADPLLRTRIVVFPGSRQETELGVVSRVLRVLAADGRIRRGHPRGTWTSSQFRWAPGEVFPALRPAEAQAEVARRWLVAYGPGTEADFKWWTGWTLTAARKALAAAGAREVTLQDGGPAYVAADDQPVPAADVSRETPWAALLPALDPTPMGWQDRSWFLPSGDQGLYDRSGNIGPTVWWNGQIIGGWAQRPDGEVVWRLFGSYGKEAAAAVESAAARLASVIGEARVTPRFRTPLERELSA
ncbi:winged helix DNA-binding domain-containing protein [Streptomyces sp. NPDC051940]|uniref:winged helix DNA-binding domain-containing protein n=1 Tax=Streptomyces sp. NPDC051940 TaxID=3155675 RepID=UPI003446F7AC